MKNGRSYVYELPRDEVFVDHITFNNLEDIGFYGDKLKIEASSLFAFLTYNEKEN